MPGVPEWLVIAFLAVIGLCLGSFVNALEWRLRRARQRSKIDDYEVTSDRLPPARALAECLRGAVEEVADWLTSPYRAVKQLAALRRAKPNKYSIATGRSMCVHCKHELAGKDLIPVFSWLWLRGRCRYCRKPIHWQYPLVESLTAVAFVASYIWWPGSLQGLDALLFALWLPLLTCFVALAVYDAKWHNLPNEVLYPALWLTMAVVAVRTAQGGAAVLAESIVGLLIIWGLFFGIFCAAQVLGRDLIGYGDVRLAALLGLLVGGPFAALGVLFFASLAGTLVILPLLATGAANRQTHIPYGPFLLAAGAAMFVLGERFVTWLLALLGV